MDFPSKSISAILILLLASCSVCFGAVYRVGDSAGWTDKANFDYKSWASTKEFHVGDVIVFEYKAGEDNVLRVNHKNFQTCNITDPIHVTDSGNDSITIRNPHSHLFFVSGVPGHCKAGQKVDIRVFPLKSKSTTPTPFAPVSSSTLAPAPAPSAASSLISNVQLFVATAVLGYFVF